MPHADGLPVVILLECRLRQQPQKARDAQNDENEVEHDGHVLQLTTPQ